MSTLLRMPQLERFSHDLNLRQRKTLDIFVWAARFFYTLSTYSSDRKKTLAAAAAALDPSLISACEVL